MESITSSNKLNIVPCCSTCHAITKTEHKWTTYTGKAPLTTERLSYCSKCYLSSFCSSSCEYDNEEHKLHCRVLDYSDIPIAEKNIREAVQSIENLMPGGVNLYINFTNSEPTHYQHAPNQTQDHLRVRLNLNNQIQGSLHYLCVQNKEAGN